MTIRRKYQFFGTEVRKIEAVFIAATDVAVVSAGFMKNYGNDVSDETMERETHDALNQLMSCAKALRINGEVHTPDFVPHVLYEQLKQEFTDDDKSKEIGLTIETVIDGQKTSHRFIGSETDNDGDEITEDKFVRGPAAGVDIGIKHVTLDLEKNWAYKQTSGIFGYRYIFSGFRKEKNVEEDSIWNWDNLQKLFREDACDICYKRAVRDANGKYEAESLEQLLKYIAADKDAVTKVIKLTDKGNAVLLSSIELVDSDGDCHYGVKLAVSLPDGSVLTLGYDFIRYLGNDDFEDENKDFCVWLYKFSKMIRIDGQLLPILELTKPMLWNAIRPDYTKVPQEEDAEDEDDYRDWSVNEDDERIAYFSLVNGGGYTVSPDAEFVGQPILELMEKNGYGDDVEHEDLESKEEDMEEYTEDETAKEFAKVFRVNPSVFDPYDDTEAMIHRGMLKHIKDLHILRSFIWTLGEYAEQKHKQMTDFDFARYTRIADFVVEKGCTNYGQHTGSELADSCDWHVFYVPDAYYPEDDMRVMCGKIERSGSYAVSLSDFGDMERIRKISKTIGDKELRFGNLDALREELIDLKPVMRIIHDGLLSVRDRSEKLECPLASVLAAWCAYAVAAKHSFYSEEGTGDNGLDAPLRPIGSALPSNAVRAEKTQKQKFVGELLDLGGETVIKPGQFANNSTLTDIIIPEGVTEIGDSAFAYCRCLRSVVFPKSLRIIGKEAFSDCRALSSVTIQEGLREIRDLAFCATSSLRRIDIPESLEKCGWAPLGLGGNSPYATAYLSASTMWKLKENGCDLQPKAYVVDGVGYDTLYGFERANRDKLRFEVEKAHEDEEIEEPNEKVDFSNIFFGAYPQTASGELAPIEWRVLDRSGDKTLLISEKVIEKSRFGKPWPDSDVRKWLNEDFVFEAFTEEEKKHILTTQVKCSVNPVFDGHFYEDTEDQVFLPGVNTILSYLGGDSASICRATDYAAAKDIGETGQGCYWWTSTTGRETRHEVGVRPDGTFSPHGYLTQYIAMGVRPCIQIELTEQELRKRSEKPASVRREDYGFEKLIEKKKEEERRRRAEQEAREALMRQKQESYEHAAGLMKQGGAFFAEAGVLLASLDYLDSAALSADCQLQFARWKFDEKCKADKQSQEVELRDAENKLTPVQKQAAESKAALTQKQNEKAELEKKIALLREELASIRGLFKGKQKQEVQASINGKLEEMATVDVQISALQTQDESVQQKLSELQTERDKISAKLKSKPRFNGKPASIDEMKNYVEKAGKL